MAYQTGNVHIQAPIKVRLKATVDGKEYSKIVDTSVGRLLFNEQIPQNLGFVDRSKEENYCELEFNRIMYKKDLAKIFAKAYDKLGTTECSILVDKIKDMGYKYSTLSAITVNAFDIEEPPAKKEIIKEAEAETLENEKLLRRGLITNDEKLRANIDIWEKAKSQIEKEVFSFLDDQNAFKLMCLSGARGSKEQINSVCGMVGIKTTASGEKIDIPIKSSFRKGLSPIEYFLSARGIRKGLTDTALKTADSGYLTRRLVDISQDVVVTTEDCFAELGEKVKGVWVSDLVVDGSVQESLSERIYGRVAVDQIVNPNTNEVIVEANEMISLKQAEEIAAAGIKKVQIRSNLTCRCKHGVCAKCYGRDLSGKNLVTVGEAVGIIAAQSIGEPGTQLTMRTFHSGGVASALDITQGLPRVEEIFEARKPKGVAVITEIDGKVKISESKKKLEVIVTSKDDSRTYVIPFGSKLKVKDGDEVKAADPLIEGSINPSEILAIKGPEGVYEYVISEIQKAYRNQGVDINDKHVEVIARQMLRKVRVDDGGDTDMFPGSLVDMYEFEDKNKEASAQGKRPATGKRVLLGITKASLATDSFLSAASFQETTRVLTEAAIKGKEDDLIGLKENVIIGKLIPAGTGMKRYQDVRIEVEGEEKPQQEEQQVENTNQENQEPKQEQDETQETSEEN